MSRTLTKAEREEVAAHIARLEKTTKALLAQTYQTEAMQELATRYQLSIADAKRELARQMRADAEQRALDVEREAFKLSTDALKVDLERQRRLALSDEAAKTGSLALADLQRQANS